MHLRSSSQLRLTTIQLMGRPRVVLHSPASLQLSERLPGTSACVLGPILNLRAPGNCPPCRPDQIQLHWQEQTDRWPIDLDFDPPGQRAAPPPTSWSLVLPLEQLLLAADRRGLVVDLAVDTCCRLHSSSGARLAAAIGRLHNLADQGLSHDWLLQEPPLLDLLVDALLAAPVPATPRQDRGWRHVIDSLRCMERGLDADISLADLSHETGVSPRALQMAFRRHLNKRPLQSLRELRLARLRHLLLQGGRRLGMAEALRRCGLTGNGTTARHYKERFGEKPSQTRA
jgi:AraC-like DNA-binding protein